MSFLLLDVIKRSVQFDLLMDGGVDNWEGYGASVSASYTGGTDEKERKLFFDIVLS